LTGLADDAVTAAVKSDRKNPYANKINISINYSKQDVFNQYLCKMIVDGLSAAAMVFFPELLPKEALEEAEFDAFCSEIGKLINESI